MKNILFHSGRHKTLSSIALLLQRLAFGAAMLTHGTPKLTHFAEKAESFANPLGIGSELSLALVVFAEFFCSILIILGLATRPAALVLSINMAVAAFLFHGNDPFSKMEMALLYLAAFLVLLIMGAGKYSLDKVISRK